MMTLTWHEYRYYPYERELARRESAALLSGVQFRDAVDGINVVGSVKLDEIERLTYFSGLRNEQSFTPTVQALLDPRPVTVKTAKPRATQPMGCTNTRANSIRR